MLTGILGEGSGGQKISDAYKYMHLVVSIEC